MLDPIVGRIIIASIMSGILVGISSPMLSLAKTLLTGLSMIHNVLAGGILAIYVYYILNIHVPLIIIAILYVLIIAIVTAELVERGFSPDTAAAITVSISSSVIIILGFISSQGSSIATAYAWSLVVGTSSIVSDKDIGLLLIALVTISSLVLIFRKEIIYVAFDEIGARAMGLNVRFYRYLLYIIIAILATILTITIGLIAAHIMIVAPGALALQLSERKYIYYSILLALIISTNGYFLAYLINLPPSGGLGALSMIFIILSEILKVRGGVRKVWVK